MKRTFNIINANDKFSSFSKKLDEYIKNFIAKNDDINVLYNTQLTKVDGENKRLSYKNAEGEKDVHFNYLFAHPDHKKNPLYENTKLSDDGVVVNVDKYTL